MRHTRLVGALGLALLCAHTLTARDAAPKREPVAVLKQLGSNSLRHGAPVRALIYSPDGKWLYSAAQDGTISQWDNATGKELARFVGHVGTVRALALSPDGRTLLSGGSDRVVRHYDAQPDGQGDTRAVVAHTRFSADGTAIESLAYHGSGERFYVGTEEGSWLAVDSTTVKEIERREVGEPVRCLAYVADKKLLVSNQAGGFAVWRAVGARKLHEVEGETLRCVAVDRDGVYLASGDFSGELSVAKLPTGANVWKKKAHVGSTKRAEIAALAFAPDGKSLVSAGSDGELRHWDAATGKALGTFSGQRGTIYALAFRPDGKELVSAGDDGVIQRWDTTTRQPVGSAATSQRVRTLSLSKDGKLALVVAVGRLELRDGRTLATLPLPAGLKSREGIRAAVLLPDGKEVVVQLADGSLHRARLADGGDLLPVLSAAARAIQFTVEGSHLAVLTEDRQLLLVDLASKRETLPLSLQGDIGKAVALSPGGKFVGVVASSSVLRVWETTSKPQFEVEGPLGGGLAVAFSPDARLLYTAGRDRMVRVTEVATGLDRQELPLGTGFPTSVALTADGRHLAVGTSTGQVHLVDTARGVVLDHLDGHRGPVTTLAFQPGTNALFSVASDGVLYLRDVAPILKANRVQPLSLSKQELENAWAQLGTENRSDVAVALQTLVRAEKDAVPLLKNRVVPIEGSRVAQWLKELDDEAFEVRDKAMRELARMGRSVEGPLKATREKPGTSVEVRVRVEELLDLITQNKLSAEYLQSLRGIEVLERVGSAESRTILEKLASGLPDAELTREAKAALERVKQR